MTVTGIWAALLQWKKQETLILDIFVDPEKIRRSRSRDFDPGSENFFVLLKTKIQFCAFPSLA